MFAPLSRSNAKWKGKQGQASFLERSLAPAGGRGDVPECAARDPERLLDHVRKDVDLVASHVDSLSTTPKAVKHESVSVLGDEHMKVGGQAGLTLMHEMALTPSGILPSSCFSTPSRNSVDV